MTFLSAYRPLPLAAATLALLLPGAFFVAPVHAQTAPAPAVVAAKAETTEGDVIARIRDEGINRSQLMTTLSYLTDVIGPRLTASPNLKRANTWTAEKLTGWGLVNAHQEAWGPFGRGWALDQFSLQVTEPQGIPLIAYPKAWSPGLNKQPTVADAVYIDATDEAGLAKYKGKLKGKFALVSAPVVVTAQFTPDSARYTEDELAKIAASTPPATAPPAATPAPPQTPPAAPPDPAVAARLAARRFASVREKFATDEGAAAILTAGRGADGTITVQQATIPQAPDTPREQRISPCSEGAYRKMVPQIAVSPEQYNRLVRIAQAGEPLKLSLSLKTFLTDLDKGMAFNTIAEIPGTDKKDEIVMCGAHMDSWHTGTGATDNGAGVAVCMEAVRILKTLGLAPRRTIRIALWSGEEQGLYGSRAYVAEHFGTVTGGVLTTKPEHEKLSGYFNLDNGTGKIRGVWCQGNAAVMPIFAEWLKPFNDLGAQTVTISNTGSTDHVPFDAVGLPGFQFIQDEIDYDTRTHHTNQDVFDRIQEADLKQAATIMAAFLYNTAQRDEKLPRKPIK